MQRPHAQRPPKDSRLVPRPTLLLAAALAAALGTALGAPACTQESPPPADASHLDGHLPDANVPGDADLDARAPTDARAQDASPDAGVTVPLPGFGDISGACGVLDEPTWSSTDPALYRNTLDLDSLTFDASALSPGGQEVWTDGNLGGNSLHSEVFAYEMLYRCELAELLKTEAEIEYLDVGGKKTDLLVRIDGRKVGVSVTRAYHYPPSEPYTPTEADALLNRKLDDILLSAANAAPTDAWERSILYVLAWDAASADVLETAYASLGSSVTDSTLLFVTVTDGTDDYIY